MDQRLVDDALARHQRILLPHIIPVDEDVVLLRLAPLGTHEAEGLLMIVPHDLAAAELPAVQKRAFLRWCPQVLKMVVSRREARRHSRNAQCFWTAVRLRTRRPVVFHALALRQSLTTVHNIILVREDVVLILNTTVGSHEAVLFGTIKPLDGASLPSRVRLPLLRRSCGTNELDVAGLAFFGIRIQST